jgi:hypothetical protein
MKYANFITMSSRTLTTFLTENYDEIVTMSSKICRGHSEHIEVAHYCIAEFLEHERAEELVQEGDAMKFLSGMIWRSFRSTTSPYHKLYRQSGRVKTQHDMQKTLEGVEDEEYDINIDIATEAILGILEEMKITGDKDIWYMAVLFEMWMNNPNYSDLSRKTLIPRTAISQAVSQCSEYVKEELKNRNIDI